MNNRNRTFIRRALLGATLLTPLSAWAQTTTQASAAPAAESSVSEIVVTAQKREENINTVGMSIQAATGAQLTKLGVTDPSQLVKIVPGFSFINTDNGTPVYSIRGVGFQDDSSASSPTVSIYLDEVPVPFSIMTKGVSLDLQRVEVLKGPQGTLFGENATGGAINYIAEKPTPEFTAGGDLSYGRFNTLDFQGFVGGPITDNLDFRIAGRILESDDWQKSYGPQTPSTHGRQDFLDGRGELLWTPTSKFTALLTISGYQDRSQTQVPQLFEVVPRTQNTPLPPALLNFPPAPHDDQLADFSPCVNTAPSGVGSCTGYDADNTLAQETLRMDYDLSNGVKLTSLTTHERFDRYQPQDLDGLPFQNSDRIARGYIEMYFQELRLAGSFSGRGSWIVGGNYEYDNTFENIFNSYRDSTNAFVAGLPLGSTSNLNHQMASTGAVYGNAEYPVTDTITLQGGVRYTKQDRDYTGCTADGGDGSYALISAVIGSLISGKLDNVGPGNCATLSAAGVPGSSSSTLNQDNVSWRVGAKWEALPRTLLYFNVSQGYKAGSFPTLPAALASQLKPVTQEGLLAFEGGFKSTLLDGALQLNGAAFYYDYKDKQVLGELDAGIFGALPALVNVPKSRVVGFELSGAWTPVRGLTITPGVSYANSRIEGSFTNFNYLSQQQNFSGESFPSAPAWQADVDVQYEWQVADGYRAFVGANVNYQDQTNSVLGDFSLFKIPSYTLLDLRAGVEHGAWRVQFWGRNVTDQYYVTYADVANDAIVRYTGMPVTYGVTLSYRLK